MMRQIDASLISSRSAISARRIPASLISTAKLHALDPQTWLADVLDRIVSGRTKANALAELLPWDWRSASGAGTSIAVTAELAAMCRSPLAGRRRTTAMPVVECHVPGRPKIGERVHGLNQSGQGIGWRGACETAAYAADVMPRRTAYSCLKPALMGSGSTASDKDSAPAAWIHRCRHHRLMVRC
jgi:hypothetical protein